MGPFKAPSVRIDATDSKTVSTTPKLVAKEVDLPPYGEYTLNLWYPPPRGREDYVQCAAARLQEQNGSLLHMNSFGAIPRVERNVLACPTLKEPASL